MPIIVSYCTIILQLCKISSQLINTKRSHHHKIFTCATHTLHTSEVLKAIHPVYKSIPSLLAFDNSVAVSDKDKADIFNRYSHSVFTKSSSIPPLHELPQPLSTLRDISISEDDVYQSLTSLHTRKAMSIDGIEPSVLKHCPSFVWTTSSLIHVN